MFAEITAAAAIHATTAIAAEVADRPYRLTEMLLGGGLDDMPFPQFERSNDGAGRRDRSGCKGDSAAFRLQPYRVGIGALVVPTRLHSGEGDPRLVQQPATTRGAIGQRCQLASREQADGLAKVEGRPGQILWPLPQEGEQDEPRDAQPHQPGGYAHYMMHLPHGISDDWLAVKVPM